MESWPFPIDVAGDVSQGGTASILVEWGTPAPRKAIDQLKCVGSWWCRLAEAGAFGGDTYAPSDVAARLIDPHQPHEGPGRTSWSLSSLRVDFRALTVLFNLIWLSELPIRRIAVLAAGGKRHEPFDPNGYPSRWGHLPFTCHEDRSGRTVTVEVTFRGEVPELKRAPLVETLQIWTLVAALGGYREAVPQDERSDLVPESDPVLELDRLELTVRDYGIHEAAWDGLVNLLARTALSIPIRMVEIG